MHNFILQYSIYKSSRNGILTILFIYSSTSECPSSSTKRLVVRLVCKRRNVESALTNQLKSPKDINQTVGVTRVIPSLGKFARLTSSLVTSRRSNQRILMVMTSIGPFTSPAMLRFRHARRHPSPTFLFYFFARRFSFFIFFLLFFLFFSFLFLFFFAFSPSHVLEKRSSLIGRLITRYSPLH